MSDDHSNDKRGKSKKSKGRKSGKAYDKRKNMFNDNVTRQRILGYEGMDQRHLKTGKECKDTDGNPDDSMCDTASGEVCVRFDGGSECSPRYLVCALPCDNDSDCAGLIDSEGNAYLCVSHICTLIVKSFTDLHPLTSQI